MNKYTRWAAVGFAAGALMVGCSKTDTPTTTAGAGGATSTTAATGTSAAAVGAVKITTNPLGDILVDGAGMTLYEFKADTADKSACGTGCTDTWPPFVATITPGAGVAAADFATFTRDDGSKQVTYKGHQVYHYAADQKAGDTGGQGIGGKWFVIGKDGAPIEKK